MGEFKYATTAGLGEACAHEAKTLWSSYRYLRQREKGVQFRHDSVLANYYKYMTLKSVWGKKQDACEDHGAIFNTEFSPDGKLLLAACERSAFLMFDPLNQKLIFTYNRAHDDGINCIRFLDSVNFLTCSDDKTISLWDIRNMKNKLCSLVGHTNWVKSIEYSRNTKQLVTSAFDDTIRVWDLNQCSRSGFLEGRSILKIYRLTRMKLTPCGTKMVVSSIAGHLVVIHNLDLDQLEAKSGDHELPFWNISGAQQHNIPCRDVPWSAKNKFEVIEEFPEDIKPWCISSLEVHPHGWCVAIRYTTSDWHQEWTALYDVQTIGKNQTDEDSGSESNLSRPKRLIYCIEEPNVARGYIKEPCFSSDGRVIGSPFGNTCRLLTFSNNCEELPKCLKKKTSQFIDFKTLISHKHSVLTCRFSPTHPLLSSGCRGGKVAFHFPHL